MRSGKVLYFSIVTVVTGLRQTLILWQTLNLQLRAHRYDMRSTLMTVKFKHNPPHVCRKGTCRIGLAWPKSVQATPSAHGRHDNGSRADGDTHVIAAGLHNKVGTFDANCRNWGIKTEALACSFPSLASNGTRYAIFQLKSNRTVLRVSRIVSIGFDMQTTTGSNADHGAIDKAQMNMTPFICFDTVSGEYRQATLHNGTITSSAYNTRRPYDQRNFGNRNCSQSKPRHPD